VPDVDSQAALARRALAALDLTSLNEDDDRARMLALCGAAATPFGSPAALCVYPEWVATCRAELDRLGLAGVRIATVANFPEGAPDAAHAAHDTRRALAAGADEIDLVFPYRAFLAGDRASADTVVRACKAACGPRLLKVILETGVLHDEATIRAAAETALAAGADFLKTSTGKARVHATPQAARILLETLRAHGGHAGFKASGGIRRLADAAPYFALADELMGLGWATPARFRLGASALLGDILATLGGTPPEPPSTSY